MSKDRKIIILLFNVLICQACLWKIGCSECIQGSVITSVAFSQTILNHTILGPVMSSITAVNERACEKACFLAVPNLCYMFNYFLETKLCQLMYKDRPGEYRLKRKKGCNARTHQCVSSSCGQGGYCYSLSVPSNQNCLCKETYNGTFCDQRHSEVCIGAKDESFATIIAPKDGTIKTFKLVHTRGGVSNGDHLPSGNFGSLDDYYDGIEILVTDVSNRLITPAQDYPFYLQKNSLVYRIPGYFPFSPEIILPEMSSPLSVRKGKEFRLWFGQDLIDFYDWNNYGTTCVLAYFVYDDSLLLYTP